jgi:hypothetical protein
MTMISRVEDWRARLNRLIAYSGTRPFEWGQWDCGIFPLCAIEAVTGEPVGDEWRGTYSTKLGAVKALKKRGYESITAVHERMFGPSKPIALARAGDVVSMATGDDGPLSEAFGVCLGGVSYFVGADEGQDGLVQVRTLDLLRCYHV